MRVVRLKRRVALPEVPGKTYELSIENEGEMYVAKEFLAPVAEVEMIEIEFLEEDEENSNLIYEVLLWAQETPDVANWYRWRTLLNGESLSDSLINLIFTPDQGSDGVYLEGIAVDEIVALPGDTVVLEQYSISEQANDIWLAMLLETEFRGGLFDSPPANVETNVSNGALGYFGAFSVSRGMAVVP